LQLWSDSRYQSLPEPRRLQLFNEFMYEVRQQQAAADAAAAAEAAAAAAEAAAAAAAVEAAAAAAQAASRPQSPIPTAAVGSNGSSAAGSAASSFSSLSTEDLDLGMDQASMSPEDLAQLQLLRWEQQRLRQEYQKMEEQLRKMEQKIRSGASSPVAGIPEAMLPDFDAAADAVVAAAAEGNCAGVHAAEGSHGSVPVAEQEAVSVEPVVESLANGEPMNVVVEGGAGDVSVEVNRDGVVVFKFSESGSRSSSRSSTPTGPESEF
jgi:hypothetical protein